MPIVLSRRNFLTSFAAGAALLAVPEPVRRYWQVPSSAHSGLFVGVDHGFKDSSIVVVTTDLDDGTRLVSTFTPGDIQEAVEALEAHNAAPRITSRYVVDLPDGWALGA